MWPHLVVLPAVWYGRAVLVGADDLVHVLESGIRRHLQHDQRTATAGHSLSENFLNWGKNGKDMDLLRQNCNAIKMSVSKDPDSTGTLKLFFFFLDLQPT